MFMAGMAVAATGTVDIAEAAPIVTVTRVAGPVSGNFTSPMDLLFDPILDAFDLVSFSGGTITTAEGGGSFNLSVIYLNDTTASLGTYTLTGHSTPALLLSTLPSTGPAPFSQGDVKGLRFSYASGTNAFFTTLSIPTSTAVTFTALAPAAVPLPATLALLPLGALALGAVGLRRRRPADGAANA
jgi:hypothetical protein